MVGGITEEHPNKNPRKYPRGFFKNPPAEQGLSYYLKPKKVNII